MDERDVWAMAKEFLSQHPSFSALSENQRQRLLSHTQVHRLPPGHLLLAPGQNSRHCWLLFSGELCQLPQQHIPPGEDPRRTPVLRQQQEKGEYFQPGDFVGVEQLIEQKIWDSYLFAHADEALLLAFSPSALKILFQKSPSILRRLHPVLDTHGVLFAGLPSPLWLYFQQQRQQGYLSYEATSFHTYRSWQPFLFAVMLFFLVVLLIPRAITFQIRYPLITTGVLLIAFMLKLRYSCEIIVSEHSLIVSTSKMLSLKHRAHAYPLVLLQNFNIKNWLLCPFLPSIGTFEFEFSGEKKSVSWIPSPHRLYNTLEVLQRQQRERDFPQPDIVPPCKSTVSRPGPMYIHKSRTLLALLISLLIVASLPLKLTSLNISWLWAGYLSVGVVLLLLTIGWNRSCWQLTPEGFFCYDSFDKHAPPWKLIHFREIEAIQVEQSWLGKILGYGTAIIHCHERKERINCIPHPYQLLEHCSLLRYAQKELLPTGRQFR